MSHPGPEESVSVTESVSVSEPVTESVSVSEPVTESGEVIEHDDIAAAPTSPVLPNRSIYSSSVSNPNSAGSIGSVTTAVTTDAAQKATVVSLSPQKPKKKTTSTLQSLPSSSSSSAQASSSSNHKGSLDQQTQASQQQAPTLDEKLKKKIDEVNELMNSAMTAEEKNQWLQAKCAELLQKYWQSEFDFQKALLKIEELVKERDSVVQDGLKVINMKGKLESLCRELQKENKRVKDESQKMIQQEQVKREELSSKLHLALSEMRSRIEEGEEYKKILENHEKMREQLKNLKDQYDLREKHYNSVTKSKDLELKLFEAKLAQQVEICQQETQKSVTLKQQMDLVTMREEELRKQLDTYADKFNQVQEAINKSNQVFGTFKQEMEQMTKKLRKLEKENESLKFKCEKMATNVVELEDERRKTLKTLETVSAQKTKLESLCRVLQTDRKESRLLIDKYKQALPGTDFEDAVKEESKPDSAADAQGASLDDHQQISGQ